jgi:predicted membrane protein (TIGR00267 family)
VNLLSQFLLLLKITRSSDIARRYFVVNGFDGALTTLGIIVGLYHVGTTSIPLVISACFGAAIALGVSGLSSGYISESAERKRELQELEGAMVTDLATSAHGQASRLIPLVIALVNGAAPFVFALLIISPLWFASSFENLPLDPLESSIVVALASIFLLGIFLGKVSGRFWLFSGLRTLMIAIMTAAIIFYLTPA